MIYSEKTAFLFILLSLFVVLNTGCSSGGSGDNSDQNQGVEGTLISARSVNNIGRIFSTPQTIYSPATDSHCPGTTASGAEKVYAAYKGDNRIYFAEISSATLLPSSPIPKEISSPDSVSPSCPEIGVSSNGIIYVVWSDDGGIRAAISNDNGLTFPTIKDVSATTGTSSSPKMAIAGNNVNLVWVDEETGKGDIFFSSSTDNGVNFSTPKNLSGSLSGKSMNPVITTDGSTNIYVSWTEGEEGSREIYYIRF